MNFIKNLINCEIVDRLLDMRHKTKYKNKRHHNIVCYFG